MTDPSWYTFYKDLALVLGSVNLSECRIQTATERTLEGSLCIVLPCLYLRCTYHLGPLPKRPKNIEKLPKMGLFDVNGPCELQHV